MNTLKRDDTVRRRIFGKLRREIESVMISIKRNPNEASPDFWINKPIQIIENETRVPRKYLQPLLAIVNDEIIKLPKGLGFEYFRSIHCPSIRLKEHGGRKGWLYERHFGEKAMIAETRMSEEAGLEGHSVRPAQLPLPFRVHSASPTALRRA